MVVCWTERIGPEVVAAHERAGVDAPGQASVAGFDGLGAFGRERRLITTVRMPWMEVARTAVGLLARRIDGETLPAETIVGGHAISPGDM